MTTYEEWRSRINVPSDRLIDPLQEVVEREQHPQFPRKFRETFICGHQTIFSEIYQRPSSKRRCYQCGEEFRQQLENQ